MLQYVFLLLPPPLPPAEWFEYQMVRGGDRVRGEDSRVRVERRGKSTRNASGSARIAVAHVTVRIIKRILSFFVRFFFFVFCGENRRN